jgi:methylenetetrahydrofolate reductase (NADPH)
VGVNLSGVGSRAGWVPAADIKAEVGRRLAVQRVAIPS